jgi:hypothetical protein
MRNQLQWQCFIIEKIDTEWKNCCLLLFQLHARIFGLATTVNYLFIRFFQNFEKVRHYNEQHFLESRTIDEVLNYWQDSHCKRNVSNTQKIKQNNIRILKVENLIQNN